MVARSKREKSDWQWFDRPAELLKQHKLVADHFTDKADILKSADATGNYIIRQIAIWAAVRQVLAAFGLDRLYGADGLPRRDALHSYAIGANGRERPRAKSRHV